jgi:hypothetical protein
VRHYRETLADKSGIRKLLFNGFSKCLYAYQKFDSDSERRFAVILERDAEKWFRPVKGQFQIWYKLGAEQPEYVPDFVAEAPEVIYQVETKAREALKDADVQAKTDAARKWCGHATDYAAQHGCKSWRYLLITHDEINEARTLADSSRPRRKRGSVGSISGAIFSPPVLPSAVAYRHDTPLPRHG